MLNRLNIQKGVYKALRYNEQKVREGKAECILAENFIKDLTDLEWKDKINRLEQRTSLNERCLHTGMHIFLIFGSSEKLENAKMQELAFHYMHGIGYGEQPYLVYRHHDTHHPHLHIVTTNILPNGDQIHYNLALFYKSARVCREITDKYSLMHSRSEITYREAIQESKNVPKIVYGACTIKENVSRVLYKVTNQYHYNSISELNAILRLYNLRANRGQENSRLYQRRGLIYHVLDEKGHRIGTPIKSSNFYFKPTLSNLEKKFEANEPYKQEYRQRVKTVIDWAFAGRQPSWSDFQTDLERENINMVLLEDKKKGQPDIYFIDHQTQCVFSGEDLGAIYNSHSLMQRCSQIPDPGNDESLAHRLKINLI